MRRAGAATRYDAIVVGGERAAGHADVPRENAADSGDRADASGERDRGYVSAAGDAEHLDTPRALVLALLGLAEIVSRGGGVIVNISTNRVYKGFANLLHYDASKGAVASMTKAMAAELGEKNIRVNAVAPGLTMSENVRAKDGITDRNAVVVGGRALKRSQQPEDLVGPVVFFASDLSAFISGQSLIVDGGGIML